MSQLFAFFADVDPANLPPDASEDTRRLAEANVPVVAALSALATLATDTNETHEAADKAKGDLGDLFKAAAWAAFDFAQCLGEDGREDYAEAFAVQVSERTANRLKSTLRGFRRDAKLAFVDYADALAQCTAEERAKARPDSLAHKAMVKAGKLAKAEAEAEAERETVAAIIMARQEREPEAVAFVANAEGVDEIEVWRNKVRYQPQIDAALDYFAERDATLARFPTFAERNWLRQLLSEMLPADLEAEAQLAQAADKVAEAQQGERRTRRAA